MVDNKRNSSSGIFVLLLMIVFFSFFQREKDKDTEIAPSVISNTNSSGLQAIIGPTISTTGIDIYWINTRNAKFACLDCTSSREFIFNNLISSYFNSCQLKVLFNNPIIGSILPQKVPEQGKEDDILSIT
ncbi:MAG: hypothetical protein NTY96_06060 [Bacteroidetes bacterium]|nr:hypothetical protein [Bacteroidota bacterium]